MIRRLALCICIGLSVPISANSRDAIWNVLQSATSSDLKNHLVIHATIFEDERIPIDSDLIVGYLGIPANFRPRKLIIETTNDLKHSEGRVWEFDVPVKNRQGDECFGVGISELSVVGSVVTISLNYEFACGAGSSIVATHKFAVSEDVLRVASVQLDSSSRDGMKLTTINFDKGEVLETFDQQEDDKPRPSKKVKFKPHAKSIDRKILVRCSSPLHGTEMPDCASGLHWQRYVP